MRGLLTRIVTVALAAAAGACTVVPGPTLDAAFKPTRRELIAFVLPYDPLYDVRTRDEYAATITQLRVGLTHVADCAPLTREDIHLIVVERVTVLVGDRTHEFETPGVAGLLLIDPEQPPRFVDPGGNPDAIVSSLQRIAASYFDEPRCMEAASPGG